MREIPRPPASNLSRIIEDGQSGGSAYDTMMRLLLNYPYQKIKASSDFVPPGASLARRMEGWEDMPYPQADTIQEVQQAVARKLLAPEDLAAAQDAIKARDKRAGKADRSKTRY
jgi:hypothetical protein